MPWDECEASLQVLTDLFPAGRFMARGLWYTSMGRRSWLRHIISSPGHFPCTTPRAGTGRMASLAELCAHDPHWFSSGHLQTGRLLRGMITAS